MNTTSTALVAAAILLSSAGVASAATETFSYAFAPASTDFTTAATLPGFDTTLGTLTGVAIAYDSSATLGGTVTNPSGVADFRLSDSVDIAVSFPGAVFDLPAAKVEAFFIPPGTVAFGPYAVTSSGSSSAAQMNLYEGATIPIQLSTYTTVQGSAGSESIVKSIANTVGADATVTYTYTPGVAAVPEPAAWAVMLAGMGLTGAAIRRRRRAFAAA